MAKNISILEGRKARNFSGTKKLRTDDRQLWIPEDEAGQYCDFETLEVTENGTYYANGCDGYDRIEVNVTDGGKNFTEKTIHRNGQYTPAADNSDGYSVVHVNVAGGGNGDYTFDIEEVSELRMGLARKSVAVVNNVAYCIDENFNRLMKYDGTSWTTIDEGHSWGSNSFVIEHNGEVYGIIQPYHGVPGYTILARFNGSTLEYIPESIFPNREHPILRAEPYVAISFNGKLYYFGMYANGSAEYKQAVYAWDGNSWSRESSIPVEVFTYGVVYKGNVHLFSSSTLEHYSYDGNSWNKEPDMPSVLNGRGSQPAVFEVNGEERIHMYNGIANAHYSFNGKFWRPERSVYYWNSYNNFILWVRNGRFEEINGHVFKPILYNMG